MTAMVIVCSCGRRHRQPITEVIERLDRIERLVTTEGKTMDTVDTKLDEVEAAEATEAADLARELADLKDALAGEGKLTDAQAQRFDALATRIQGNVAAIDAVDAQPAPIAVDAPAVE